MNGFAKARKAAGLTQTQVAETLRKDQTTIAKWETGKSFPRVGLLQELARLYQCTIEELISGAVENDTSGNKNQR